MSFALNCSFFSLGTTFLYHSIFLRVFLLVGCFTKRAQFPFIRWLPAAIAAPTPVSALVHSSTLVTAGVYLIIRFFTVILDRKFTIFIIALISRITIFISAFRAIFETDFKKIIALSTLRQLGFIIFRLSQIIKICRFFHLITHAIFKSLLFICAGVIIIYRGHNQDIRSLPGFTKSIIQRCFIIARIALIRTPFLVGFYSKDLILEIFFQNQTRNWFLVIIVFARSWLTVAYSLRMMFLRIWQTSNFKFIPFFRFKNIIHINKSVVYSTLACIFAGRRFAWLFSFETKFFIPKLLSIEINFICSFIFLGTLAFFFLTKQTPLFSIFHIVYLTPLLQKFPEPFFLISKKLFNFSDLGWLEKISFLEITSTSIRSSSVFFKIIRNRPLIKQIFIICFFLFILWCF